MACARLKEDGYQKVRAMRTSARTIKGRSDFHRPLPVTVKDAQAYSMMLRIASTQAVAREAQAAPTEKQKQIAAQRRLAKTE